MATMKRALCLKEALTRATPLPVNHYERVSPGSTKVNVRWVGFWVFTMSNPTCVCNTNSYSRFPKPLPATVGVNRCWRCDVAHRFRSVALTSQTNTSSYG